MNDASCSGGTPFKQFIDHQSRDVSHHQDRLVNGASSQPHGSFRSHQHPGAPAQDGFGAFMDSPSAMAPMHHHPADRLAAHAAALQPAQFPGTVAPELTQHHHQPAAPDVSSWAADFSKFASTQPQQRPGQQRQRQHQHQPQPMFQNAFGMQHSQAAGAPFSPFFAPAGSAYGQAQQQQQQQAPGGEADFDKEMAQWMATNASPGAGNMEQVDAAMEQMARELELNDSTLAAGDATAAEALAAEQAHFSDLGMPEMSNLSLEARAAREGDLQEYNESLDALREENAAEAARAKSAVSEAAERLLESVQHESGEKWQNSVFLKLMRDFRDGRKDIVDNEVKQMMDDDEESAAAAAAAANANENGNGSASPAATT